MALKVKSKGLSIAVIGLGHMGELHIKKLINNPLVYELIGIEKDQTVAKNIKNQYEIPVFSCVEEIQRGSLDACIIATPTVSHYDMALKCLERGISLLIEKPLSENLTQAYELKKRAEKNKIIVQVGLLERFQPSVVCAKKVLNAPLFVESHRLGVVKERSFDIDVILDLMIHDIDLILHLIDSPVVRVEGIGVAVVTKKIDLANARIYFENEAIAQLTASRISMREMRKIRFFQEGAYVSVDSLLGQTTVVQFSKESQSAHDAFHYEVLEQKDSDALSSELQSFLHAVIHRTKVQVSLDDAIRSLKVAFDIQESIYEKMKRVESRYSIPLSLPTVYS